MTCFRRRGETVTARIVVVHDDPELTGRIVSALERAGHEVSAFAEPIAALELLEAALRVDLLVTRVRFAARKSHGVSLALVAKSKQPGLKVLFLTKREHTGHVKGVGEYLLTPFDMPDFMAAVERLLRPNEAI